MHGNFAVLFDIGRDLEIVNLEIPSLQKGQVLVKIFYSGICRSQLMEIDGHRTSRKYIPHLLGHEASGEVVQISQGVTKIEVGDKVIVSWIKGKGLDSFGSRFKFEDKVINAGPCFTLGEYAIVAENRVFRIPREIPLDHAAAFGCAVPTGSGIIIKMIGEIKEHERVLVVGLGGIGLSAVHAVVQTSNCHLSVLDLNIERINWTLKNYGSRVVIISPNEANNDHIKDSFDYVIESTGTVSGIELAFRCAREKGGKTIFASHPEKDLLISLDPFDFIRGKRLEGSWGGEINLDEDLEKLIEIYASDSGWLSTFQDRTYSLESVNEAITDFRSGKLLRPLICLDQYNS